jgi:hypothetical protein
VEELQAKFDELQLVNQALQATVVAFANDAANHVAGRELSRIRYGKLEETVKKLASDNEALRKRLEIRAVNDMEQAD